jgi:hypothetical protein
LQPHQGQHVVSLISGASVRVVPTGGFSADEIHLWLNETPHVAKTPREAKKDAFGPPKFNVEPDRMLALGNVKIAAEQLDGQAGRLEVWFRTVPSCLPVAAASSEKEPVLSNGVPPSGEKTSPPTQKFQLDGDLVRIQLLRCGEATSLDEVSVEGRVKLVEMIAGESAEAPLTIRGQALKLTGGTADTAVVSVLGRPAEVSARGMTLRGSNIQLSRANNQMWIEGAGQMWLPVARDLNGAPLERATQVEVAWRRSLVFDGLVARFQGDVEAKTQQQWARGDQLAVTLSEKLDFANVKSDQPSSRGRDAKTPEVDVIEFSGHFAMENRSLDKQGQLASIEKMQAEGLRVEQRTGVFKAAGPGWVSTVRRGGAENPLEARGFGGVTRPAQSGANDKPHLS